MNRNEGGKLNPLVPGKPYRNRTMGASRGTLFWDGEGAERGILTCGVITPLSSPILRASWLAGVATPDPTHTLASQALARDTHATDHTETMVKGTLAGGGPPGWGGEGLACATEAPWALHRDCWSPLAKAKRKGSLCASAPSPHPQARAPRGRQRGSPQWRQGREDRIQAGGCSLLLPAPVMPLPAKEGTLCGACGGCAPRPNSPDSPSRCRTQPHRPAAPCMYSYSHKYRVLRGQEPPCPSGHPATLEGWGQGAIALCQLLTSTPGWDETPWSTPPPALSLCHSMRFGAGYGQGWAIGVPPSQTVWEGADLSHHPVWCPALPCSPTSPSTFPLGWDGGMAVLCTAVTQPVWPGKGWGASVTAATSLPHPHQGQEGDSSSGRSYGLYVAGGCCRKGARSGGGGVGRGLTAALLSRACV